jgi:hypothetical protein
LLTSASTAARVESAAAHVTAAAAAAASSTADRELIGGVAVVVDLPSCNASSARVSADAAGLSPSHGSPSARSSAHFTW